MCQLKAKNLEIKLGVMMTCPQNCGPRIGGTISCLPPFVDVTELGMMVQVGRLAMTVMVRQVLLLGVLLNLYLECVGDSAREPISSADALSAKYLQLIAASSIGVMNKYFLTFMRVLLWLHSGCRFSSCKQFGVWHMCGIAAAWIIRLVV